MGSVYTVTTCAKTIIVGEHAVIYGASAIAIPLKNLYLKMCLSLQNEDDKESTIVPQNFSNIIKNLFNEGCKLLNVKQIKFNLELYSNIPIGCGLGSSAALCVGIIRILNNIFNKNFSQQDICEYANILEKHFHGNPSGLDTAVIELETPILFSKSCPIQIINYKKIQNDQIKGWPFVLINSGISVSTKTMVKKAQPYFIGDNGYKLIRKFDTVTEQSLKALVKGDLVSLGDSLNQASLLLNSIGVVGKKLQHILDCCAKCKVLGAKPTGAGGGGCVLVLLNPKIYTEQLNYLKQNLAKYQFIEIPLN